MVLQLFSPWFSISNPSRHTLTLDKPQPKSAEAVSPQPESGEEKKVDKRLKEAIEGDNVDV